MGTIALGFRPPVRSFIRIARRFPRISRCRPRGRNVSRLPRFSTSPKSSAPIAGLPKQLAELREKREGLKPPHARRGNAQKWNSLPSGRPQRVFDAGHHICSVFSGVRPDHGDADGDGYRRSTARWQKCRCLPDAHRDVTRPGRMRLRANRGDAVAGKTEHVIVSASAMRPNCSEQITDGRLRSNLTLMLAKILETLDLDEEHGEGRFLLSRLCHGRADGGVEKVSRRGRCARRGMSC